MGKIFKNVWFRCISVLLAIALTSGGLLAILNKVLEVTPYERTMRAIKKIYGVERTDFDIKLDVDDGDNAYLYKDGKGNVLAKVTKVYDVGDVTAQSYDMLFKSEGGQGYKNGTITLWIKVIVTTADGSYKIDKVILESYEKQTLMSKLGGGYYSGFKLDDVTEAYQSGELFAPNAGSANGNPVSGATMSANAGCNAVNGVIDCIANEGWEKE